MSRIEALLEQISTAVYGNEVRGSIHDAIEECYSDVSAAKTLADQSIVECSQAIVETEAATSQAASAASNANVATVNANAATVSANQSASQCNTAVAALPQTIIDLFSSLGLTVVNGKLCVGVERE